MPRRIAKDDPSGFGKPSGRKPFATDVGTTVEPAAGVADIGNTAEGNPAIAPEPATTSRTGIELPFSPEHVRTGTVYTDPLDLNGAEQPPVKRRRGRQPGSKNRVSESVTQEVPNLVKTLASVEAMVFSLHLMGASALAVPELAMSREQSKDVADAIAEVAKHYNFGVDPKTIAWFNLSCVLGGHWVGAGIVAYRRESSKPKPVVVPSVRPQPSPVITMPNADPLSTHNYADLGEIAES